MISVHFSQPSASRKNADRSVITQSGSATASASSAVDDGTCAATARGGTARGGAVAKPSNFSGDVSEVPVLRTCLSPSSLVLGHEIVGELDRAALRAEAEPGATVTVPGPSGRLRYRDALDHAAEAGRRGAAKIAFDMRQERRRGI